MNRRLFLSSLAASSVSLRGATKPNVLFLFADDQRADTISAYGNRLIRTPNIDTLVKSGVSFRNCYTFGSNNGAVCVPSRAMLMSGRTWFHVDAPTIADVPLMPAVFGDAGYSTFGTGKWHNGTASFVRAFQQGRNIMFGGMSDHTKVPVRDLGPGGTLSPQRIGHKFSSELFADSLLGFLESHDRSKPFFAYAAFTAPHDPRQPPDGFLAPYRKQRPPLPPNFLLQLPFDNGMMNGGRDENLAAWPRTENVVRDQLAEYYGLMNHLDTQIGRILKALRQTGRADNTIIVYAADNGLAIGSHGLMGKQSVYEHSMRVPLIISGRGIARNRSVSAFAYLMDLFPSLCDVAGIAAPGDLDGRSLRPVWEGNQTSVRDSVFLPFLDIQRAIRDERWKLIAYPKIGYLELFDLQNDPHETRNLQGRPEHAGIEQRLRDRMREWQERMGDRVEIPAVSRPPERIDLSGQPRQPDQWQPEWIVRKYFNAPGSQ
jgi:arylsulfatase A-like enzyme